MGKKKIYLETTLFNHYYDTKNLGFHDDTKALFRMCAEGKFEPYTSRYVIDELKKASSEKYDRMVSLTEQYNIEVLDSSDEASKLAKKYIFEGALPKNSFLDAMHIAAASVNELDIIVSLNFRHIVRERTIELTGKINVLSGYKTIEINSPKEATNNEKNR